MSDNNNNETVGIPERVEIPRNGVTIPFTKTTKKRGEDKGAPYLSPEKASVVKHFDDFVKWYGMDKLVATALGKLKQSCQIAAEENTTDDGTFNLNGFIDDIASLSARGDNMKDLNERKDEIMDELVALSAAGLSADEYKAEATKLSAEAQDIMKAIQSKKRAPKGSAKELAAAE